jgi:hypothetical protein
LVCVTRYDCAHDFPHRDVLGKQEGLLYKQRFPGLTLEEVFYDAIRDCQENYEAHASFFRAHQSCAQKEDEGSELVSGQGHPDRGTR